MGLLPSKIAQFLPFASSTILVIVILSSVPLLWTASVLVGPIVNPRIMRYPWPPSDPKDKNLTIVLAGSYNPPHSGHLAMLTYLSQR
jgi:uncharacterized SAM-binding protein YcdF (DUF218 family)